VLDFSSDALEGAEKGYYRLMSAVGSLQNINAGSQSSFDVKVWRQSCYDAMNDDFNSPILIAQLFEGVKYVNQLLENKTSLTEEDLTIFKETFNAFVFDVLGLVDVTSKDNSDKLGKVVEMLIDMRNEARANKNWALSDKIRDKLAAVGVQLKDGKEGTTFSVN
jgi:cysteinyl-tRNA synthetase